MDLRYPIGTFEHTGEIYNLGLYSWHGRHHGAQITSLQSRSGVYCS